MRKYSKARLFARLVRDRPVQYEDMKRISDQLAVRREEFFDRWVAQVNAADIQYPGIISDDILQEGSLVYSQLVGVLQRPSYQLAVRKRINPIGKRLGERRAMTGVPLEATLELFILFRHELWQLLAEEAGAASATELLELRRRIDLYLDQLIASIAYAYTSTKEKAMVGLIEKLLS
jgi:hypothetical protein